MRPSIGSITRPSRPHRHPVVWVAAALVALAATGCATASGGSPFGGGGGADPGAEHVSVFVQNLGLVDQHIYAVTPRGARDLGTVKTGQNRVFHVPWSDAGPIYFRLDDVTDPEYTTQSVNVAPGDQVEVDIPADGSYVEVRVR